MKKLLLSIVAMATVVGVTARNPLENYPNDKGDVMVCKCYDAQGNLHGTMKYTIGESTMTDENSSLEIVFVLTDKEHEVIDYGTIYANYFDGNLNVRMSNHSFVSDLEDYLSLNTKIMNDFLDYPDRFDDNLLNPGPFQFDAADYTIKSGANKHDYINVKVMSRNWEGEEAVNTPAGKFDAEKITFNVEIFDNVTKQTRKYKGTEWYSMGKGIVRTEIRDKNNNLVNYSELAELHLQDNR